MVTVLQGQSLLDIAIRESGDVEAAFDLAVANGISVTDALQAGDRLTGVAAADRRIVNYYRARNIHPATWPGDTAFNGGIGEMAIEVSFIVA